MPRAPLTLASLILVSLAAAGCRSAVGEEAPPRQAQAKVTEVGAPAARGTLGCGEVGDCSDRCGRSCPSGVRKVGCLLDCKNVCRAKGCASAQRLFDTLTSCIALRCFVYCMTGPSSRCNECIESKCAAHARACKDHRC